MKPKKVHYRYRLPEYHQEMQKEESKDRDIQYIINNIHNIISTGNKLLFIWVPSHCGIVGNEKETSTNITNVPKTPIDFK